jgi:hypothetical protein
MVIISTQKTLWLYQATERAGRTGAAFAPMRCGRRKTAAAAILFRAENAADFRKFGALEKIEAGKK